MSTALSKLKASAWVCMTFIAPSAFAQAFEAVRLHTAVTGQDSASVGAALISGRKYQGSDERSTALRPVVDFQWTNGWFAGMVNGIGYDFVNRADMNLGLRLTADFGRKQSLSSALNGMGDVPLRAEFGGFFNTALGSDLTLSTSLRRGSGEDKRGMVLNLGVHHTRLFGQQWMLATGVSAGWGNGNYMQSYFGVTPQQSATSGYAIYSPGSGLKDVKANGLLTYLLSRQVALTAGVSLSSLQGDTKASPLVRSRNSTNALFAASYRF